MSQQSDDLKRPQRDNHEKRTVDYLDLPTWENLPC